MVVEAESYIDRFDLFSDTLLEPDEEVEFGTGVGEDLRVQVYGSEGVDPVRAVFLLLLYDLDSRRLQRVARGGPQGGVLQRAPSSCPGITRWWTTS